ncbi:MAG: helix-hairpin-helix domain-containing protein [Gammaproteobacteria bacterium]|nr:helix-hairpin-helix domain-containing protein [Gammaproteobacteria bacterium]MBU1722447.1 helix-hairpin-helix domain-containing protein [Gammaproteobacteria bacterium]MBU2004946.1 helix-hairpin-helix domain-containing protein [Gammaproteobacteria bacterium]
MKKTILLTSLVFSLFTAPAVLAEMVNINKADAATLQANLNGVGEKKAEAIVAYRTEHGEFKALEELKEVSGIGDGIYKKIEADISLSEGATSMPEEPAKEKTAKTDEKSEDKTEGAAGKAGEQGKKAEPAPKADKASDKPEVKADKT